MDQASPLLPQKFVYKKTVSVKDNLKCCVLAGEGGKPGNEAMFLDLVMLTCLAGKFTVSCLSLSFTGKNR